MGNFIGFPPFFKLNCLFQTGFDFSDRTGFFTQDGGRILTIIRKNADLGESPLIPFFGILTKSIVQSSETFYAKVQSVEGEGVEKSRLAFRRAFLSFFLTAPGFSADGIQIRPLFRLGRDTAPAESSPQIIVPKPMTLPGENGRQGRTERVASLAPPAPPAVAAGETLLSAPPAELTDDDSLFVAQTISTESADAGPVVTDAEPNAEPVPPSAGESAAASPAETAGSAAGPDSGKTFCPEVFFIFSIIAFFVID